MSVNNPRNTHAAKVAAFHILIEVGEERTHITLSGDLRIFLLHCLVERLSDPALVHTVLALDLQEASLKRGSERRVFLKRVADASLLLAGLFPERRQRLHVDPCYFRSIGRVAYARLADDIPVDEPFNVFARVAKQFVLLESVLRGASGQIWDKVGVHKVLRSLRHPG